jgi:YfiH family protein
MRSGDDEDIVAENRRMLENALELPSSPRWLRQVHGAGVALEPGFDEPEADAAITSTAGRVLAILTADCLPVVFAASDGSEVAVAHAGWRGLSAGVLEATAAAMQASPDAVQAWLGPAAGPQAYEIGEEVFAAFVDRDPRAATAFAPTRPGHWRVDLYTLARQRLADAGVTRVHGGGLCTISDPRRFYSHRRDQRTGRMATLVWRT